MKCEIDSVAMFDAADRIHGNALEHFRGEVILEFPDHDEAGRDEMLHWEHQLGLRPGFGFSSMMVCCATIGKN
jgi:hypothetical protein